MSVIFKFNGGHGAVLCNCCRRIVMAGHEIPDDIFKAATGRGNKSLDDFEPVFCSEKCKKLYELEQRLVDNI